MCEEAKPTHKSTGADCERKMFRRRHDIRTMAETALKLTSQKWNQIGQGDLHPTLQDDGVKVIAEKIVSILFVRLVAVVSCRAVSASKSSAASPSSSSGSIGGIAAAPKYSPYTDYSTTTIARSLVGVVRRFSGGAITSREHNCGWAEEIPAEVVEQLREYVLVTCENYRNVPYHNVEHAYHVFMSANKLLDLMLHEPAVRGPTFGIKSDPLLQMAFLFSALVHDVDHSGISNRQLVIESDDLAILYNDQSVAEQRSLAVAFSFLKRPEFDALREVLFQNPEDHFRFRKSVINLVLTTDIASPERTQIVKSKWKEAFGEEEKASKVKKQMMKKNKKPANKSNGGTDPLAYIAARRESEEIKVNMNNCRGGEEKPSTLESNNNRELIPKQVRSLAASISSAGGSSIDLMSVFDRMSSSPTSSSSSLASHLDPVEDEFNTSSASRAKMDFDRCLNRGKSGDSSRSGGGGAGGAAEQEVRPRRRFLNSGMNGGAQDSRTATGTAGGGGGGAVTVSKPVIMPVGERISKSFKGAAGSYNNLDQIDLIRSRSDEGNLSQLAGIVKKESQECIDNGNRNRDWGKGGCGKKVLDSYRLSVQPTAYRNLTSQGRAMKAPRADRRLASSMITPKVSGLSRSTGSDSGRLGIRRAFDFSGSIIESFETKQSLRSSTFSLDDIDFEDEDEVDELKASVVLEQMLKAADVSALLQNFESIVKWSTRLYKELKDSALENRGEDPDADWYDNQISFFKFYILPLAQYLGYIGVFEEETNDLFVGCVEKSMKRWIEEGREVTEKMMLEDIEDRKRRAIEERENYKNLSSSTTSMESSNISVSSEGVAAAVVDHSELIARRLSCIIDVPETFETDNGCLDDGNCLSEGVSRH